MTPTITGFDATGADGTYGPGDTISIDATASEPLIAGSAIRATLTNGEVVTLTADTGGTVLTGSYTVDGTDTSLTDLDVSSFALGDGTPGGVPADLFGNEMTSTTLPADLIANSQDIIIDTGKPLVTAIERLAADDSNIDTDGVTSTTPMTFKVSFSEAIDASTVTAGDFVASNGTVGTVTEDSEYPGDRRGGGVGLYLVPCRGHAGQRTERSLSVWLTGARSRTSPATRSCTTRAGMTSGSVDADGSLASF